MKTLGNIVHQKTSYLEILDDRGNEILYENSHGFWWKYEFDDQGNVTFYVHSDGFWRKSKFDDQGNEIYYENSKGFIHDTRP